MLFPILLFVLPAFVPTILYRFQYSELPLPYYFHNTYVPVLFTHYFPELAVFDEHISL